MSQQSNKESGSSPTASQSPWRLRTPLRVLVVDDDKVDRLALKRALTRTGAASYIGEADGVMAAINLLATENFDCVLLDYNLPDGDGLTFLRGIRGAGIATNVVMITGQQDADVARELLASGAVDYIPKAALTTEVLLATLERAFPESPEKE